LSVPVNHTLVFSRNSVQCMNWVGVGSVALFGLMNNWGSVQRSGNTLSG